MSYLYAFLIGGALCMIAQLLIDKTKLTPARILTLYVIAGVFLGAIGVYSHLASFAKSGASVPLTGFGYLLYKGTKSAVDEKGILGAFTGGLSETSAGIAVAITLAFLSSLIFRSKRK